MEKERKNGSDKIEGENIGKRSQIVRGHVLKSHGRNTRSENSRVAKLENLVCPTASLLKTLGNGFHFKMGSWNTPHSSPKIGFKRENKIK